MKQHTHATPDEDLDLEVEAHPCPDVPSMYRVMLLNDDYTPMDFVVKVLCQFFDFTHEQAVIVMLKVHDEGRGFCGIYSKEVAQTKVAQVNSYARAHGHPLLCIMEKC